MKLPGLVHFPWIFPVHFSCVFMHCTRRHVRGKKLKLLLLHIFRERLPRRLSRITQRAAPDFSLHLSIQTERPENDLFSPLRIVLLQMKKIRIKT